MNWPASSQKYGAVRNGRCASSRNSAALLHDTRARMRFQLDLSKRRFVLAHVLLQYVQQGLGLLRADVNALKILDGHVISSALIHHSEGDQEIPERHANLNAVGI